MKSQQAILSEDLRVNVSPTASRPVSDIIDMVLHSQREQWCGTDLFFSAVSRPSCGEILLEVCSFVLVLSCKAILVHLVLRLLWRDLVVFQHVVLRCESRERESKKDANRSAVAEGCRSYFII